MAEKKKILYIVEAMGGGVFTYIVDLANELVNKYDMYIAYSSQVNNFSTKFPNLCDALFNFVYDTDGDFSTAVQIAGNLIQIVSDASSDCN